MAWCEQLRGALAVSAGTVSGLGSVVNDGIVAIPRSSCSMGVSFGSSSGGASVDGRSCWTLFQTLSALSPIPLFSTSSRAIAVSMSSSLSIAWRPSEVNLPSIAKRHKQFLAHQAETYFLHRALLGKELHLHRASLTNPP